MVIFSIIIVGLLTLLQRVYSLHIKTVSSLRSHFLLRSRTIRGALSDQIVDSNDHQVVSRILSDETATNTYPFSDFFCTVHMEPVPLARHRIFRGRMFNPSSKMQEEFAQACISALPSIPLSGPIEANLCFYLSRPKSHFRTGKYAGILRDDAPLYHTGKKDIDNLIKFVLDALNKKVYYDDAQIAVINARKFYTIDRPRVEVNMRSLESSPHESTHERE